MATYTLFFTYRSRPQARCPPLETPLTTNLPNNKKEHTYPWNTSPQSNTHKSVNNSCPLVPLPNKSSKRFNTSAKLLLAPSRDNTGTPSFDKRLGASPRGRRPGPLVRGPAPPLPTPSTLLTVPRRSVVKLWLATKVHSKPSPSQQVVANLKGAKPQLSR